MGSWIFGCDDCQEVCPVNRRPLPGGITALRAYDDEAAFPALIPLLQLTDAEFRSRYRGTPLFRTKSWGVQRNVCVALGNAGDDAAIAPLADVVADPEREPIVREHAAWALGRLESGRARRALDRAWPTANGPLREELALALDRAG
jgi:epoxyqueuosine reductase